MVQQSQRYMLIGIQAGGDKKEEEGEEEDLKQGLL